MKKIILILILVVNIFPVFENGTPALQSASKAYSQSARQFGKCSNPGDCKEGFFAKLKRILGDIFHFYEEEVQTIISHSGEDEAYGGGGGTGETRRNYSTSNTGSFDWGLFTGTGIYYYNPPPGTFTPAQLTIISRLGYIFDEYELLNPGMNTGITETGFNVTYNGGDTKFYNGGTITVPQESITGVEMTLNYDGEIVTDPTVPVDFIADPNSLLPPGSYTWYKDGVLVSYTPIVTLPNTPGKSHIQVKRGNNETVLDIELEIYQSSYAIVSSTKKYVTPGGTPIMLDAGTKVVHYNLDRDVFTNGAIYGFVTPQGKEYIFTESNNYSNSTSSTAHYDGCYEVVKTPTGIKKIDKNSPYNFVDSNYPTIVDKKVRVVRFKKIKVNGECQIIEQEVDYIVGAATPLTVSSGTVDQNEDIENAVVIFSHPPITVKCPSEGLPSDDPIRLDSYFKNNKERLKTFLDQSTKNSVKFFLFDCATGKVKNTIDKTTASTLDAIQQDAATDQFNNKTFTEDIAIKGCIENGKWKYEVAYKPGMSVHPKVGSQLQQVKDEIKNQADDEVKKLGTPGQKNSGEVVNVENGEKFYKKSMDFLESIAAIYDVGKDIISTGALPKKVWNGGNGSSGIDANAKAEYDKSPFNAPSLISGAADQLIDEVTGIVQLAKAGMEVVRHPKESAEGLWKSIKSLNGDKVKQMISSVSGAAEYTAGGDRAKHQAGMHSVQAAMIILGPVKALTKGKDVLDGAGKGITDVQKFIPDGTTGHPSANALKNAADNGKVVKKIDDDKVLTQNVEGGQNYTVGVEKNGNDVKVYKVKDDELVDHRTGTSYSADDIAESAKDIDKPKTVTTVNGKQQIETDAGGTGSWNKELNNPKPDAEYRVKNNGATPHKYTTDGAGRITNVEADLNLSTRSRNGYQQSVKCKGAKDGNPTDHGGHLIGSRFDGAGEQINLVPMTSNLNLSQWKSMENSWENLLQQIPPKNIKIEIKVIYDPNVIPPSKRPIGFEVIEFVDGQQVLPIKRFNN